MSTTYKTFIPAVPDEDHQLFLMAIRPTTEAAMSFCAIVKRHLAEKGLGDPYEMYIFSEGDEVTGQEGPSAIWLRSRQN